MRFRWRVEDLTYFFSETQQLFIQMSSDDFDHLQYRLFALAYGNLFVVKEFVRKVFILGITTFPTVLNSDCDQARIHPQQRSAKVY